MATNSRSSGKSAEQAINAIFRSPWLWGMVVTFLFYWGLPYLPFYRQSMKRYFNAHWIENIEMGMFFIGLCTLIGKLRRISAERGALEANLLDGLTLDSRDDAVACATKIDAQLNMTARQRSDTRFVKRVRDACEYVTGRRSSEGLEGYLTSLAEVSAGRLRDGYSLIRTMSWSVPILGFLGTVIGITIAIAKINPEKLELSLPKVTAGLAAAFDSTTLGLALSMVLVFGTLIVEQFEQRTLEEIEDHSVKQLWGLFPSSPSGSTSPLELAEQKAAEQLLIKCENMITRQMEMWQTSLESLRERWSNTLSKQQGYLDQALQTGLTNAIADHSQQLVESRSEFMTAFRATSESIGRQLAQTSSVLAEQQQQGSEQISQTWQQFRSEITKTRDEHARQLALLTKVIATEVGGWQTQLETSTQSMSVQLGELRVQGNVFLKITESQSELVRLERRLAENLEAVRVVESLEHTLLNLNAAIHLLTTRVKSNAA